MVAIREFVSKHPRLVSWFVLALGMVIMLLWAAKDVGLLPGQMVALVVHPVGRFVRVDYRLGMTVLPPG